MAFLFLFQNHYHENAKNPGNRTEGEDGSIQNQEPFSGKACQRIQLKSAITPPPKSLCYVYVLLAFIFRY